jgi:hypothetical protein
MTRDDGNRGTRCLKRNSPAKISAVPTNMLCKLSGKRAAAKARLIRFFCGFCNPRAE